ncbi:MAG: hypothetical protein H8D71_02015 [Deltaproteobacteria bacterium]|jgi:hypothetical protein|nr:hypothetical protein [Deltaproteobacteria bacterium]
MQIGLNHLHTNLAHLLVLFALINMILAVLGAGKKASLASIMAKSHKFGVMMLGRLIYIAGLGLAVVAGHSFAQPWILAGVLLWGAVEVAGKRLVSPELEGAANGGPGSGRLMAGAAIQLVVIVLIYGLMQVKPAL